jgi:hypothetical protein
MLIDFVSILIAAISIFIALEILGTYKWHVLFHRRGVQNYMRGKYVCGHCSYENTEAVWKANVLQKIGDVIDS